MISEIPVYLKPYIAKQDLSLYTPIDQATWRFILRVSRDFFSKTAHQKYLAGLDQTGITTEQIPSIEGINSCLNKFDWQAVAVVGFIPSEVFMEFLSLGILPIACDMRSIDHIAYTPAPDIVHEAAGHAPIIADPEYRDYLKSYGEVSRNAIFSSEDIAIYEAIRHLSDVKEDICSSPEVIEAAEQRLQQAVKAQTFVSEATLLSRMGWWTFEYGLVEDKDAPKIYGAGLLSSLQEGYHCLDSQVKKLPFSIACTEVSYDITRPQPQLFVAKNFHELKNALEELANQMAFRTGGVKGLEKALQAQALTTVELDSGVQVSGVLTDFKLDSDRKPFYIRFGGPTQISYLNEEIRGQGPDYHREGFSTPLAAITDAQLEALETQTEEMSRFQLDSGVTIEGKLVDVVRKEGRPLILTFDECTVTYQDETLFKPEWGKFDLACGREVVSVFGGAADRKKYLEKTGGFHQEPAKPKTNLTPENRDLNGLYAQVRRMRESKEPGASFVSQLIEIYEELDKNYPQDWLLRFELLELGAIRKMKLPFEHKIRKRLFEISQASKEKAEIIQRGLGLL